MCFCFPQWGGGRGAGKRETIRGGPKARPRPVACSPCECTSAEELCMCLRVACMCECLCLCPARPGGQGAPFSASVRCSAPSLGPLSEGAGVPCLFPSLSRCYLPPPPPPVGGDEGCCPTVPVGPAGPGSGSPGDRSRGTTCRVFSRGGPASTSASLLTGGEGAGPRPRLGAQLAGSAPARAWAVQRQGEAGRAQGTSGRRRGEVWGLQQGTWQGRGSGRREPGPQAGPSGSAPEKGGDSHV